MALSDQEKKAVDIALVRPSASTKVKNVADFFDDKVAGATFTIGAEAANAINVAVQFTDKDGNNMAERCAVPWYLSSDANGDALATAPDGGVAVGSDGLCIETLSAQAGLAISAADGAFDVNLTESSTGTWYLVLVLPNGSLAVSGAITFA